MMNTASNIVLVGSTGAGKSSIAKMLATPLELTAVDLDREIEQRVGASVKQIFEEKDEAYFRAREADTLNDLLQRDGIILATGAGSILDPANREIMRARAFVIHIEVSVDEQIRRLCKDQTRPLLQRPDREEVLQRMAEARTPFYREVAHMNFNNNIERSSKGACAQLLTQILRHWKRP